MAVGAFIGWREINILLVRKPAMEKLSLFYIMTFS